MNLLKKNFNLNILKFLLITTLFSAHFSKIWTPEDLAKEMRTWNSLIDPEAFLIEETDFAARLQNNYLTTNKIYDKVDVNLFVIPRIPDRYAYTQSKYADELMEEIEKNPDINIEKKKNSYLTIIFVLKQSNVIIKTSEKLKKLISKDDINNMIPNILTLLKSKHYPNAILLLFEKFDELWRKYRKPIEDKKYHSQQSMESKRESVQQMEAIVFVVFAVFILIVYLLQKYSKKRRARNEHED